MIWLLLLIYVVIILVINFILSESQRYGILAKFIYILTSLFLVVLLLFRGVVGVDWKSGYVRFYDMALDLFNLFKDGFYLGLHVEPGFQFYLSILKTFNIHENWIPTILLIFILISLYFNCIKYKIQFIVVISLFTLSTYLQYYGQIRMAVVYSIGILVLTRLAYDKNIITYRLILLSSLIHYVSIFYLILNFWLRVFMSHNKKRHIFKFTNKIKSISVGGLYIFVAFLIGQKIFSSIDILFKIINYENFIFDKYISYSSRFASLGTEVSYSGAIFLTFLGICFTLFYKSSDFFLNLINRKFSFLFFVSVFIFLLFNQLPVLSYRLSSMLLIPSTILLGNIYFERTKNIILFLLLFLYQILKYYNLIIEIGDYNLIS
jgi:hypothetical protein